MKRRLAWLVDLMFAMFGVMAVLAMGGSWLVVFLVAVTAAAMTMRIWRRSSPSLRLRPSRRRRPPGHTKRRVRTRSPKQQLRHDLWRAAQGIVAVIVVWNLVSFASYVSRDNGDTFSERVATWGRDNHLGKVIDFVETRLYNTPPSKAPAKKLALTAALVPSSTSPPSTASSGPDGGGAPATSPPPIGVDATVVTSTSVASAPPSSVGIPAPLAPVPLAPLFAPSLPGEGQWTPIARAAGQDAMWATSIRPLPAAGGVVASMVVIDQTHLRAGLFNGAEEPGGTWKRSNRVPAELQPALLAAMNGGFRFEHIKGGYKTEGVTVKPLRDGDATLAVGVDGHVAIGQLGRDLFDDGSWISLRQNLVLIVDGGRSQVQRGVAQGVWWGADYGNRVYVPRSAVCELADGRIAYALVGRVNATELADSLINLGCVKAMQMDINGTWPVFFTFTTGADGSVAPHFLDKRMGGRPDRYLTGSTKEFFAFFDATLVPSGSVLDS